MLLKSTCVLSVHSVSPPPRVFIAHNMSRTVRPTGHSKASLTFRLPQCSKKKRRKKTQRDEGIYYFERRESMRVELKPLLNEPALPAVTDHANAAASLVEHHDFTLHVLAGQAFHLILGVFCCFCNLLSHSAVKCGPSVRFLLAKFMCAFVGSRSISVKRGCGRPSEPVS